MPKAVLAVLRLPMDGTVAGSARRCQARACAVSVPRPRGAAAIPRATAETAMFSCWLLIPAASAPAPSSTCEIPFVFRRFCFGTGRVRIMYVSYSLCHGHNVHLRREVDPSHRPAKRALRDARPTGGRARARRDRPLQAASCRPGARAKPARQQAEAPHRPRRHRSLLQETPSQELRTIRLHPARRLRRAQRR